MVLIWLFKKVGHGILSHSILSIDKGISIKKVNVSYILQNGDPPFFLSTPFFGSSQRLFFLALRISDRLEDLLKKRFKIDQGGVFNLRGGLSHWFFFHRWTVVSFAVGGGYFLLTPFQKSIFLPSEKRHTRYASRLCASLKSPLRITKGVAGKTTPTTFSFAVELRC